MSSELDLDAPGCTADELEAQRDFYAKKCGTAERYASSQGARAEAAEALLSEHRCYDHAERAYRKAAAAAQRAEAAESAVKRVAKALDELDAAYGHPTRYSSLIRAALEQEN